MGLAVGCCGLWDGLMGLAVGFGVRLDGVLLGEERVLERLLTEFVGGQVVAFAVSDCGGRVSLRSAVMQFCGAIMGALGHLG